ncbi:MAG: hypothetical protein IJZ03_08785 [Clostridia bacterium]|nr:hypothetical protein [Clostridia bacterium]
MKAKLMEEKYEKTDSRDLSTSACRLRGMSFGGYVQKKKRKLVEYTQLTVYGKSDII